MTLRAALALSLLPVVAFAAGSSDNTPPTKTETTEVCTDGMVWDEVKEECAAPSDARLDDKTLYDAAREFAYAGQLDDSRGALEAMQVKSDGYLTYMGFISRKSGDLDGAEAFYQAALALNPNNLGARSYMGQGYVAAGKSYKARAELTEIRTRGGRGSWAEISLRMAIEDGSGFSY